MWILVSVYVFVSMCVYWNEAWASTTSRGLSSWLCPLMQAFSVRRSSWRPIYTEAKHSNTHRQANRGSLWCQSVCERVCVSLCVLISYWASCSAHDWLQTLLILSLGCIAECELHYNSGSKSMSALEAVKLLWGGRNVSLQFKTTTTKNNNDSNKKKSVGR